MFLCSFVTLQWMVFTLPDARPGLRHLNVLVAAAGRGREAAGNRDRDQLREGARLEAGCPRPQGAECAVHLVGGCDECVK